jgi:hypothetical protein
LPYFDKLPHTDAYPNNHTAAHFSRDWRRGGAEKDSHAR